MELINILALVLPSFIVGMYFDELLTDFYECRKPKISDIICFEL